MRVLIVNTSEKTGGAAVAANRLMEALNNNGVKAKMLVADKQTDNITVVGLPHPGRHRLHFLWERWCIFWHLHFKRDHLFEIDTACAGTDITSLPEYKEADVIHLAWINQGMLSLKDINKILADGKPRGVDHARHVARDGHLSLCPVMPPLHDALPAVPSLARWRQ